MDDTNTNESTESQENFEEIIGEILVSDDKTFEISIKYVDKDGKDCTDTFVSKIPSVRDIVHIGVKEAELLVGTNTESVAIEFQNIAFFLATLSTCLVKTPDWFNIDTTEDLSLIEVLYTKHSLVVEKFRKESRIKLR